MSIPSLEELDPHDHAARSVDPGPRTYPPPMAPYLGLKISRICHNTIVTDPGEAHFNHCAHFVCHVMRWNHIPGALKCSFLSHGDTPGVHVRVNELFNVAPNRTAWVAGGALPDPSLVYATVPSNIHHAPPIMGQHDRKHVGLYYQGKVWHYSTAHATAYADSPREWRTRMAGIYGADTVFYRSGLVGS